MILKFTSLFVMLVLISSAVFGQDEVEIKMKKFPVSKSFSLGQRGLLLYGEDPKNNSNQKELVLIKDAKIEWFSQCMPSSYGVTPIYSDESNYVYFVEEGFVNGGNLGYVFVDNSGTSRKGKLNISLELRKIGVNDASKLDLVQMHSTTSYFMLLFEEKSGSESSYYAIFVGHASQKIYPMKLVHSSYENKEGFKSSFQFLGSKGELILLAQRAKEAEFHGFYISEIDPKTGKDETRKISFPIMDMAWCQKIILEGNYYASTKELNLNSSVKSSEFLGQIQYVANRFVMLGLEFGKSPGALRLKTADDSYTETLDVRIPLDDDFEIKQFLEKLKNGVFGFEFTQFRQYYIGAISSKQSLFMYIDSKSGKLAQKSIVDVPFEELRTHAYYIIEDLRKRKSAWFEACGADMYSSSEKIWGKMEYKIYRNKL